MPNTVTPTSMNTSAILQALTSNTALINLVYTTQEQAAWAPTAIGSPASGAPDPSLLAATVTSLWAEIDRRIPIPA